RLPHQPNHPLPHAPGRPHHARTHRQQNPDPTPGARKVSRQMPKRRKVLTPTPDVHRIRSAVAEAARYRKALGSPREISNIAEALLVQAILNGDVQAAAFATRTRMQRENNRLRQRLALTRMRTERIKQKAAEIALRAAQAGGKNI